MITVRLTDAEIECARKVGLERRWSNVGKSNPWGRDPERSAAGDDCQGATGELAFALAMGVRWQAFCHHAERKRGDVGPYEVKSTTNPRSGLLLNAKTENPARWYFLAKGSEDLSTWQIVGGALGCWVLIPRWARPDLQRTQAEPYIMPAMELIPIESFHVQRFPRKPASSGFRLTLDGDRC